MQVKHWGPCAHACVAVCLRRYTQLLAVYTQLLSYSEGNLMDVLQMFLYPDRQWAAATQSDTK